jgi:hypothetical protein
MLLEAEGLARSLREVPHSRCPDERRAEFMTDYVVKPLDAQTWDAFARLVERHNGVFGGCWCTWFPEKTFTAEGGIAGTSGVVRAGAGWPSQNRGGVVE